MTKNSRTHNSRLMIFNQNHNSKLNSTPSRCLTQNSKFKIETTIAWCLLMPHKALVLFSGGLDSLLAIEILQEQGVPVEAVHLRLPFTKSATGKDWPRLGRPRRRRGAAPYPIA